MDLRALLSRRPSPTPSRAPFALPALLDRLSERWWSLPPRVRATVLVVAVVVALAAVGRGATTSPWGPPRQVLVAAVDRPVGGALGPDDVRTASWPDDLVPADAIAPDDLPVEARLRGFVAAGTVVTRQHLATGMAGLVDDGEAAVAVPADGLPLVRGGDVVDVVAAHPDGSGVRVASAARVLAVEDAFVWLGVAQAQVDAVAAAGAAGRLTLAVRPAPT